MFFQKHFLMVVNEMLTIVDLPKMIRFLCYDAAQPPKAFLKPNGLFGSGVFFFFFCRMFFMHMSICAD